MIACASAQKFSNASLISSSASCILFLQLLERLGEAFAVVVDVDDFLFHLLSFLYAISTASSSAMMASVKPAIVAMIG